MPGVLDTPHYSPSDQSDIPPCEDMLFDREADPLETRNLIAELPEIRNDLGAILRQWERDVPRPNILQ